MNGISTINIELTNRCNKTCAMCGRRKTEQKHPGIDLFNEDMDWRTFMEILPDIQPGMVVQLHWNGEPSLYPLLKDASLALRKIGAIVCMNTNGLLLEHKWRDYIHFHSVTVSIIQGDTSENYQKQRAGIITFLDGTSKNEYFRPLVVVRALGKVPPYFIGLPGLYPGRVKYATRVLHAPQMSREYVRKPTMPEIGICLDLLHHPAIDVNGNVYPCVRYNPYGTNKLGNIKEKTLEEIMAGDKRQEIIQAHLAGKRNTVPLCHTCHYWGCPTSI
jgi:radical SAM protein with 4Fe4S-binding SPASM domain